MGFFDNYIIPLAKKLKDCGVFGVSSDEYLDYAVQNRAEWEERGQEIVASFVEFNNPNAPPSERTKQQERPAMKSSQLSSQSLGIGRHESD